MKFKLFVVLLSGMLWSITASATLSPGSLMVVAFDGDNGSSHDHFAFVLLADVPNGEVVYMTDGDWTGTAFTMTEGFLTWTNNTGSAILAGTVVTVTVPFSGTTTVSHGIISESGSFSFTTSGDEIFIYQGPSPTMTPTNFITAFSSDDDGTSTLAGTGLTNGVNAIADAAFGLPTHPAEPDVLVYTGTTDCSALTVAACAALIANPANWASDNGGSDDSVDGAFPDVPAHIPPAFNVTLPIQLVSFKADLLPSGRVELRWETAVEINNDFMAIERSNDAVRFTEIGRVDGQGNSNRTIEYSFIDERPRQGANYYRLRQVDYDGSAEYHGIVVVQVERKAGYHFFPNPVTAMAYLTTDVNDAATEQQRLEVFDAQGRLVMHRMQVDFSDSAWEMDWSSVPSGIYTVRIVGATDQQRFRVVKE